MNTLGQIGRNIRRTREKFGIKATYVAKKLSKSVSAYWYLENSKKEITLEEAKKIAEILRCDIEEFFEE